MTGASHPLSSSLPSGAGSSTIVLIDPASEATTSFASRLEMQGYAVAIAHDPASGARLALADPPAAVIADLWMPSISGVQLCRLLKAEPATEHVPVILRGPDSAKNRFWAERAGASAYVIKGRMGDLARALREAIAAAPANEGFFTTFAGEDIRDRIAAHLDAALFESVLSAELRALGSCGAFDRLFDLLSQFLSRVATYRWFALSTVEPARLGLHANSRGRQAAEEEARRALGISADVPLVLVEDDDACDAATGASPIVKPIELGGIRLGHLALSLPANDTLQDEGLAAIIAREIASPIRMAILVEESRRLATSDSLTGLMNRRAFVESLKREIARSARYGDALSLVLFDLDHFKKINDRHGHGTGDLVLQTVGQCLNYQIRTTDFAARWGGEEFVVILTSTDSVGAACFCERLRHAIELLAIPDPGGARVPVTASLGHASYTPGESLDQLVERADKAMYVAKTSGRNRVVAASPETPDSTPAAAEKEARAEA